MVIRAPASDSKDTTTWRLHRRHFNSTPPVMSRASKLPQQQRNEIPSFDPSAVLERFSCKRGSIYAVLRRSLTNQNDVAMNANSIVP